MADLRNPVVQVQHRAQELRAKPTGGSPRKIFGSVPEARAALSPQWAAASNRALQAARREGLDTAVVKVRLKPEAIAKTHRPLYLLEQAGRARVIGARDIGTLLLSITEGSAAATLEAIEHNDTQNGCADVTTISAVETYQENDVFLEPVTARSFSGGTLATLFDYRDPELNLEAEAVFRRWAGQHGMEPIRLLNQTWRIDPLPQQTLRELSTLSCLRTLSGDAHLQAPVLQGLQIQLLPAQIPAPPIPGRDYPIVGVLDTGIHPNLTLQFGQWLAGSANFVVLPQPPPDPDFEHASFISGLLVSARSLNTGAPAIPEHGVRVWDARVFSAVEGTKVSDVLARIQDSVRAQPAVKVWNLSLGIPRAIDGKEFSEFSRFLDDIARRHGVLFVIAAGNYTQPLPLRSWPNNIHTGLDRIGAPADSVLGLSVGSIAHETTPDGGVKAMEPTPYSRRGPGIAALPKPEVVHHGGNCTLQREASGSLLSYGTAPGSGRRDFGTSFSAPLIASLSAQIWKKLESRGVAASASLVKAFVIHAAAVHAPVRPAEHLPYYGFGLPQGLDEALLCSDEMFTTYHSVNVPQGQMIQHEFPMPACLIANDHFRGEIIITLCYDPLLDSAGGEEYCRSNVNVSMGPMLVDADGVISFRGKVPPDPRSSDQGQESTLIEHGFKWSPVKVYRKRFPRGQAGTRWQLRFEALYRAGQAVPAAPQAAHALVTVRALDDGLPVYADGLHALNQLNHAHQALLTAAQLRV